MGFYVLIIIVIIYLVPSVVTIPRVKNYGKNQCLEWLSLGVRLGDEGAAIGDHVKTLNEHR